MQLFFKIRRREIFKWVLIKLIFFSFNTYAYNGKNCKEELFLPVTQKISASPATWLLVSTIAPTSTSQFVSSSGSCSAVAEKKIRKKEFLVNNYHPLKIDIAKGGGEYIYAYAILSGCYGNTMNEYSGYLQKSFIKIYGENSDAPMEEVYNNLERAIEDNNKLRTACSRI